MTWHILFGGRHNKDSFFFPRGKQLLAGDRRFDYYLPRGSSSVVWGDPRLPPRGLPPEVPPKSTLLPQQAAQKQKQQSNKPTLISAALTIPTTATNPCLPNSTHVRTAKAPQRRPRQRPGSSCMPRGSVRRSASSHVHRRRCNYSYSNCGSARQ